VNGNYKRLAMLIFPRINWPNLLQLI